MMQEDPHFDEFSSAHANGLKVLVRVFNAATAIPAVQLLSNGRYHAMITNAGGGCSIDQVCVGLSRNVI
jgi:hypothetical protein